MPRPGPLQDLPLDHFLPTNPNLPSTSRKRPLSPGGLSFASPAKRRILNEQAICKSPLSGRGTPARFSRVLTGPSSPARKLDFGSPKLTRREATPPRAFRAFSEDQEMDDYFSHPSSSSSVPPPSSNSSIIPRETPPPLDPQSIHYPGFRVYFDTHIILTPVEEALAQPSTPGGEKEREALKENIVPRRRPRKVVTVPDMDLKAQLFSPHAKEIINKAKSTTPRKAARTDDRSDQLGSPTPRRFMTGLIREETSSTPRLTETGRKDMRRLLQDEADDEECA
ncbi:hypothetical protein D9615_000577 [Tricholomella constricta]|uniref:Uncharacterized protein n=1 Tax=Tricholomella constricta TaxID=117010 RepID=A0A8H5HR12_9AGAR|nr:hypothetical protein D9615_000577 [Tricholomella constricta]